MDRKRFIIKKNEGFNMDAKPYLVLDTIMEAVWDYCPDLHKATKICERANKLCEDIFPKERK